MQDGGKEKQKKEKVLKIPKHFRRIKAFALFDTQMVSLLEF
jgi:hypothetical protein